MSYSSDAVADIIELVLICGSNRSLPQRKIQDRLEAWSITDTEFALGINQMAKRSKALRGAYPFDVSAAAITSSAQQRQLTYTSLLLMTSGIAHLSVPRKQRADLTLCLEHVVEDCLRHLYGPATRSLRFGHPSEHGRPPGFPDSVLWLGRQLGIKVAGTLYRDPRRQDGGLDVVVWRPFPDGQEGFPLLLVQATVEPRFAHKANDLNARLWALLLGLDTDPPTALAIPGTVSDRNLWEEISTRSMLLDRLRLSGLEAYAPCLTQPKWEKVLNEVVAEHGRSLQQLGASE
jgi:hypothetical protein